MSTTKAIPLLHDYDAVIFDMDGVLIDSEPLWKIAMEYVFGQYGSTLTHEDFQKTVGLRIDEVIAFWNAHENWGLSDLQHVEKQIIELEARFYWPFGSWCNNHHIHQCCKRVIIYTLKLGQFFWIVNWYIMVVIYF